MKDRRPRSTRLPAALLLIVSTLIFSTPALAQDDSQGDPAASSSSGALVDPAQFDALLPDALPGGWKKDRFTSRTSASEHWGGATYLHEDGRHMQIELRHYTPTKWEQARAEGKEEAAATMNVAGGTGFYDPTHRGMPTSALSVYLENNFAARVVGPGEAPQETLATTLRQVPTDEVIALAKTEAAPGRKPSGEPITTSLDPETLASFLPETVAEWKRVSWQTAAGPLPTGPTSSDLRPLFIFLPEVLMRVEGERPAALSGVNARYEGGGPRPMSVGIVDYGALPDALLAAYREEAAAGKARAVRYAVGEGKAPGYEGTGTSDDAVPPHGVKALVGGRFEVVVVEQPPEGVSSVADFKALPSEKIEAMLERARTVLQALDLQKLDTLAASTAEEE